jgi:DNA-directed RNA polymerase subunit RPC12/RpoP
MAEESSRVRNIVLTVVAVVILAYAVYAIRQTTKVPPASNADQIWMVCTTCWKEFVMTTAEIEAATDQETGAVRCPECGQRTASVISRWCPECKRAIPRSMVVIGSDYVCPFCKAPLGSALAAPPPP